MSTSKSKNSLLGNWKCWIGNGGAFVGGMLLIPMAFGFPMQTMIWQRAATTYPSLSSLLATTMVTRSASLDCTIHRGTDRSISMQATKNEAMPNSRSVFERSRKETRKSSVDLSKKISNGFARLFVVIAVVAMSLGSSLLVADAAGYGSLSDEQKLIAEAWRLVDNSFVDRTFNGLDWFALRQQYVKQQRYKDFAQAEGAIADMVSKLGDKYTRYLTPAKYQSLVDTATGTLAGVGVEIALNKDTNNCYVADVEPGSPAQREGIQPGDIFVQVDGVSFQDGISTPDDVALKLRGPEQSRVSVTVQRNGQLIDLIITRQPITITAVRGYLTTGNTPAGAPSKVGVIRIKNFSGTTASTVAKQWSELKQKGAEALVLDVRGNPGGLLPGGVETASLFLDDNRPVVFVVSKSGIVDAQYTLGSGSDLETPIIVLTDGNTASAAEVFTAALQENGRAVVVGDTTFGKGTVQTVRALSDNHGGLAITVARYETPQHHNINQKGIPADISTSVTCPKDDAVACLTSAAFRAKPAIAFETSS